MATFGLQADSAPPDSAPPDSAPAVFYLWPESIPLWNLWHRVQTQWRIGLAGREGLDYAGLSAYLHEVARIKPRHFDATFSALQAMERVALDAWASQRPPPT